MAATKDIPNSRVPGSHRLSVGSPASGVLPGRQSTSRPHAHSVSLGASMDPHHRVNRRKSSSSMAGGLNMTALRESVLSGKAADSPALSRSPYALAGSYTGKATSGTANSSNNNSSSAIIDGPPLSVLDRSSAKARSRRASEGSRLSKNERRRSNAGDLKCETCGKGYKHGSCLTKHLWEHTPEWQLTSKLLISKHQQVQLLEAASVLVAMNQDTPKTADANESAIQMDSDNSGDSPMPSGSSDMHDDASSRTSTPPHEDLTGRRYRAPARQDSYSSALSRSYQSTAATSYVPGSYSDGHWYGHSARPSTASSHAYDSEDQADVIAAAQGLVSCNLGTPKQGPTYMQSDVPPVPPLPAKFAHEKQASLGNGPFLQGHGQPHPSPYEAGHVYSHVRGRSEEDDEGFFGRMEQ